MKIIDAHQHFWNYDPVRYDWIDQSMAVIRRDFLPGDLKPILEKNNVVGTIAVQAEQSVDETNFLLELADEFDFILGVVGWIDLQSDALGVQLDSLSHFDKLVGFRHIVQGEEDPLFVLRPEFIRGLEMIFERGYTYDLLIYPHQLVSALELIKLFPRAPIVIDHLAKPYIKRGFHDGWAAVMKEIGQHPEVYCKWSGMITEADWKKWQQADFSPYLETTFESFSADRLMFGSDWPVLNVAGTYHQVVNVVRAFISNLPEKEQNKVLYENAKTFYLDTRTNR